jgi:chemotaxis signal transduction protein
VSPTRIPPRQQTVIVLVEAAGQTFGLPIAVVQDVVNVSRHGQRAMCRVQRAPASIDPHDGTIEVGGRRVQLVELSDRLGLRGGRSLKRTRCALVVRPGEDAFGLLVDTLVEIVEIPWAAVESVPPTAGAHPAIGQRLRLGERAVAVLDVEQLAPFTAEIVPETTARHRD